MAGHDLRQSTALADSFDLLLHCWQQQILSLDYPRSILNHVLCRQNVFSDETLHDRVTYSKFRCRLLLSDPAVLFLEWRDLMITAQASYSRCIPCLLLTGLVAQSIQDRSDRFIGTYLG